MDSGPSTKVPPWVWALVVSIIINLFGAAYVQGTVVATLNALNERVARIERNMDAVTNIVRGPVH